MRGIRLVVLLLVMVFLVTGLLVTAGPAAADGRQFTKTSGPYSVGCSWDSFVLRQYPPPSGMFPQSWVSGPGWTVQDGQLYLVYSVGHSEWHFLSGSTSYHTQVDVKLYPVSSYTQDPSSVTGWYEGRLEENGVTDGFAYPGLLPPFWKSRLTAEGKGDLAGQTVQGTSVPTDWGITYSGTDVIIDQGLCPGAEEVPFVNGTMTLQFTGKP